ncbi:hypothetical protein CC1G_09992 [Coprinopsis cinerea okayama7|uniref:Secreted protein n=1 Tax=Coprinopsis cinerea (strain Okayama-7 / 130 / ATCC MYA-4618 / FGSC 9003) TaxID=240176 RepID=A8NDI2_COPC7|nr:hypothetical protein CC1G_09992 [Coprinopsis cinerea okayama7\|eukprot:XP_001832778.1 hypothetical protein CC1G_09992 [Coprinopsis cinerea okayama7\
MLIQSTFLYLAYALTFVLALPQNPSDLSEDCPEIIPGPGLPSLASLNLTSADLCKSPEEFQMERYGYVDPQLAGSISKLSSRQTTGPWCGSRTISPSKAKYCYNYLYSLGNTACAVGPLYGARFCTAGGGNDVAWYGNSLNAQRSESPCRDVARGGQWVLDNCVIHNSPLGRLQQEGSNFAAGSTNIVVRIENL